MKTRLYILTFSLLLCQLNLFCQTNESIICLNQEPVIMQEEEPICTSEDSKWIYVPFADTLYTQISWSALGLGSTIYSDDLTNDSILVSSGSFEVNTVDYLGSIGFQAVSITKAPFSSINTNFLPICDYNSICWTGSTQLFSASCHHTLLLKSNGISGWEDAQLEILLDGNSSFISIDDSSAYKLIQIYPFQQENIQYVFHSGSNDAEISFTAIDSSGELLFQKSTEDEIEDLSSLYSGIENCTHTYPGTWESSYPDVVFDYPDAFVSNLTGSNCITVDPDFTGTFDVYFTSDLCAYEWTTEFTFSATPEVTVPDYTACYGEEVTITPTFFPETGTPNWIPNSCGTVAECTVYESGTYIFTIDNVCGSAQAQSIVTFSESPGEVTTMENNITEVVYLDNPATHLVEFTNSSSSPVPYTYVITTTENQLLGFTSSAYDFSSLAVGLYRAWGIMNITESDIIIGENLNSLDTLDCPNLSSNYVEILVELIDNISEAVLTEPKIIYNRNTNSISFRNGVFSNLILTNTSGQIILQSEIHAASEHIEIPTLARGIYLVSAYSDNGISTMRFHF